MDEDLARNIVHNATIDRTYKINRINTPDNFNEDSSKLRNTTKTITNSSVMTITTVAEHKNARINTLIAEHANSTKTINETNVEFVMNSEQKLLNNTKKVDLAKVTTIKTTAPIRNDNQKTTSKVSKFTLNLDEIFKDSDVGDGKSSVIKMKMLKDMDDILNPTTEMPTTKQFMDPFEDINEDIE